MLPVLTSSLLLHQRSAPPRRARLLMATSSYPDVSPTVRVTGGRILSSTASSRAKEEFSVSTAEPLNPANHLLLPLLLCLHLIPLPSSPQIDI
eukprot:692844-Hanusia_phi.AAC.7